MTGRPRPGPTIPTNCSMRSRRWWAASSHPGPPPGAPDPGRRRSGSWPAGSAAAVRWISAPERSRPSTSPDGAGFPSADRVTALTGLPTALDNDAKALALGEGWVGAARGSWQLPRHGGLHRGGRWDRPRTVVCSTAHRATPVMSVTSSWSPTAAMRLRGTGMPRGRGLGDGHRRGHRSATGRGVGDGDRPMRTARRPGRRLGRQRTRPPAHRGGGIGRPRIRGPILRRRQRGVAGARLCSPSPVRPPDRARRTGPTGRLSARGRRWDAVGHAVTEWSREALPRDRRGAPRHTTWLWPVALARAVRLARPGWWHRCAAGAPSRRSVVAVPDGDGLRRYGGRDTRTGGRRRPPVEWCRDMAHWRAADPPVRPTGR